ncbi:ester cyclase [Tritonibacter scottomollicae]|uniref:SnoaL-like polyketide cyclase n=1 Tax=Tritonibacter scottomollicae TaxID=483013 RepID=A0A2T1A879_TRISK|nr:ester cyclase [Tritonibacter scottomollicae]PRZ44548.1 SnoaL-like polyketide cyclase [Tritonibacter scottomollicae]
MDVHTQNKALIAPLRAAMYDFDAAGVRAALGSVCTPDVLFRFCHPFGDLTGVEAFYDAVYAGLFKAWPDLERRDTIVIAGPDEFGNDWVGAGGYYTGVFTAPWLDIPPSGHQVSMRFHEFYRIVDGKVVEVQALWDIPEVMMQANAWPMAPSLGREWHVPAPATQDGLVPGPYDAEMGAATCQHIIDMLEHLKKHPAQGGPEVMEMERFWHPRMNWYGPSGIGTGRGIAGFRNWHQIPFLNGMPDRGQYVDEINYHFFGDGDYAAVTGWPNMIQTVTHDGWLGIAPAGRKITMRSLDFWRLENGKIRENWVLVDLLDAYAQLGVDVFARLREFNKARNLAPINIPNGMS